VFVQHERRGTKDSKEVREVKSWINIRRVRFELEGAVK
jgi:hypothetical protein